MNTLSANTLIEAAKLQENFDGLADGSFDEAANSLELTRQLLIKDVVASGGVWTGDSYGVNRNASMTSIIAMIGGKYVTHTSVAARTFTASKDTYVDIDNAGTLTYTEVTNNAASPALAANNIRVAIVVTGASTIAASTSINQGQPSRTLPSTCNVGRAGIDSLGNKIFNKVTDGQLIFISMGNLLGSGDLISITLPLLRDYDLSIQAQVAYRWTGVPAVANYLKLYVDGNLEIDSRIDVYINNMLVPNNFTWRKEVSSGSRIVKLNLAGGGSMDFTVASMIIIATPR